MGIQVDRMKQMRKERGLTQFELAELLHISRSALAMWEAGRTEPTSEMYAQMSLIFGCSVGYLMGTENDPHGMATIRIPILGDTAAGLPIVANREYDEYIDVPVDGKKFDAAVRVTGDSMEPNYRIGDLALVRYQEDVLDGQIAVVCIDDEVTLKRLYHMPNGVMLQSDNPKYKPMIIKTEDVGCLHLTGRAIGCIHWEE